MNSSISARDVALDVLIAVDRDDAYANLLLPQRIVTAGLSERDAQLATELCHGTLRWRGYYDAIIERVGSRTLDELHPVVLNALRLGAHQLLRMRVSTHAAVNESVAQVKRAKFASAAGYVNAILRRISEKTREEWDAELTAGVIDENEKRSIFYSHPAWIVRAAASALAADGRASELDAFLAADNVPTALGVIDLSPDLRASASEAELLVAADYSPLGFHPRGGGSQSSLMSRHAGLLRVQDEGSQIAALALVNARPVGQGEKWLDMCSAPGGKSAVLAAAGAPQAVQVIANEANESRVSLVRSSIAPWPNASTAARDGRDYGSEATQFDRVLVDAPCTGLGALRRRPEARWRKTPRDVAALTSLQEELLVAAIDATVVGGVVAYVTCSPHTAETRAIVDRALKRRPGVREMAVKPILDRITRQPIPTTGSALSLQLWPHAHQTDAMFIALLEKSSEVE